MILRIGLVLLVLIWAGCDSMSPGDERVIEGVDLDVLFAPPTRAEIDAVSVEWAGRTVSSGEATIVRQDTVLVAPFTFSVLYVVAQTVDQGIHYSAVAVPLGATGPLPVFLYTHPGDGGVDIDETLALLTVGVDQVVNRFVFVAPSFRSEPLGVNGVTYLSTAPPSPLDRDVDDTLALLEALPAITPLADTSQINVLGLSRGAGVALLLGARRPGLDGIVAFFGPTDFFGPYVQEIVADALLDIPRDLPGFDYLNETYIQPLKDGQITIADVRPELVRRSAVLFAERLPRLQLHHGDADVTVNVSQAVALIDAMAALGRTAPAFESYIYPGAGHNPLEMTGSFDRVVAFFEPLAIP
ncbi:MAG: hypothetical protein SH809_05845 [Rhodothermales bacterium]|nr:hypothetical protein [Rhodothermales bacterium]